LRRLPRYTTILKKIQEKGAAGKGFATKEVKRVEGLVKSKISAAKKTMLETRLNILKSFVSKVIVVGEHCCAVVIILVYTHSIVPLFVRVVVGHLRFFL
jgi:hypothetical protein